MKRSKLPKATAVVIGPNGVKPLTFEALSVESIGPSDCIDTAGADSPRREFIPDPPTPPRPN